MQPKKTKRRIMRRFTIDEISGVDIPAQEGATAVIAKRALGASFQKSGTPLLVAKFGDGEGISYTHLNKKESVMSTIERDVAALEAMRSKIDILLAELGRGSRKDSERAALESASATSGNRERQIAFLEDEDEDVSEEMKSAMAKFMRGRSPKLAAKMAMRRLETGAITKARGSDFMKHVHAVRDANPRMSRQQAMRKARREHPESFRRYQAA